MKVSTETAGTSGRTASRRGLSSPGAPAWR